MPFNDFAATDSGSVYVYRFDGTSWFQQAVIRGPGNRARFGQSVDLGDATDFHENIDADLLLIVGAPRDHDFHGAAYTFFLNEFGWHGWQELYAIVGDSNTWGFGRSVSVNGGGVGFVGRRAEGAALPVRRTSSPGSMPTATTTASSTSVRSSTA